MLIKKLLLTYKKFKFALKCISRKNNLTLDETWFDI